MQAHDATRVVAMVGGVLGLGLFYQPWVEGKVPGIPAPVALTGFDLAAGRSREMADAASIPPPRAGAAPVAGGAAAAPASSGNLVMPTRVPTFAPGSQGSSLSAPGQATPTPAPAPAASGGLTLPTRVPTFAPGAQGNSLSMPLPGTPTPAGAASGSGASSGGMTLPTRVPTFAPGAQGNSLSMPVPGSPTPGGAATRAPSAPAAGAPAGGSGLAAAAQATTSGDKPEPAQLPKLTLYAVPVAGFGVAAFTATFGLLRDPRDRRFAKWWTVLFGIIGAWAAGTVVSTVGGAEATNDLLAPGQATTVLWAAWGTVGSFVASVIGLAWTWVAMARRENHE